MDKIVNWLSQNYEWFLSGLGITVIGIIGRCFVRIFSNNKEKVSDTNETISYKNKKNVEIIIYVEMVIQ